MTFDDDFLQLELPTGIVRVRAVEWPPPHRLETMGVKLILESFSSITDEQRAGMTRVCRGARYVVDEP